MGLDAQVLAIGPYSEDIAKYLEYPESFYNDVEEGSTIITLILDAPTTDISKELAAIFGFDAWDLGQHAITKINESLLFNYCLEHYDSIGAYDGFKALQKKGFLFFYRPNG